MNSSLSIAEIIVFGLATVKYMMILESFKIPERTLGIIKKTENDWLRLILAKTGMFFDCPICVSVFSAMLTIVANSLNQTINLLLAISVLGLFLKKKTIDSG